MARDSVGEIALDLSLNSNGFKKQLSGIANMAKKAGAMIASAFAVKKLVEFGKSCIELGSDLSEVQNVVDVTFPQMSAQVDQFAKSAAASFGLSETMAKKYTGTFGAMAKAFGFTEEQAYQMGTSLTGLAGDVASFYNISQDEAYTKLKSVFTGETESLKDLGVVMTQTALDSYALANGFGKTTSQMSEAEKVALRYQFVQNQLTAAAGDFARTSDGWANQVRILSLQFDSLKATIGQGLINLLTPVIKVINIIIGKLTTLANVFKAFTDMITGKKSSGGVSNVASDLSSASSAADSLSSSTDKAGSSAKKAAKEFKQLAGFDTISKLSDSSDSDSDSGSSGGSSGGGGGAANVDFGAISLDSTALDVLDEKTQKIMDDIQKAVQPTIDALHRLWEGGLSELGSFAQTALQDFYDHFISSVGEWVLGEGLPRLIDLLNQQLSSIDFDKINDALVGFWDALAPFAVTIGEGLLDFYEHVMVPLGTWVANEAVPRFFDTLSIAISAANSILEALRPLFVWFYDEVLTPIASWAADIFLDAWDAINETLSDFSDWCKENPTTIQNIAIAVAAFFAAWKISSLVGGFISFASSGDLAIKMTSLLCKGASLLAKAFTFLTSPVGIATVVLGTLITIGVLVYKNWDTIKEKAIEIWGALSAWFSETIDGIVGYFTDLWEGIQDIFTNAAEWLSENWNAAKETAMEVWGALSDWFWGLIDGIIGYFTDLWNGIQDAFAKGAEWLSENWNAIKETAMEIWGAISEWFSETIEGIKGFFTGLWEGIQDTFADVGEWFQGVFEGAMKAIRKAFSTIGSFFSGCWNTVKRVFSSVGSWFYGIFSGAWSKITSAFSSVGSFFSDVWRGIQSAFGSVSSWFHDTFTEAWTAVKNVFCTGGEIFSGIVDGILDGLKGVINAIIRGINDVIAIPFNGLNSALDNLRSIEILSMKPFSWLPSISVPQIPELAQGGYVKANTPQLALIGDNRHQGEVVAPENKLREMAAEASGTGNAEVIRLLKQLIGIVESMDLNVILEFRGQLSALARTLEPYMERERNRKGRKLTTGGVVIG